MAIYIPNMGSRVIFKWKEWLESKTTARGAWPNAARSLPLNSFDHVNEMDEMGVTLEIPWIRKFAVATAAVVTSDSNVVTLSATLERARVSEPVPVQISTTCFWPENLEA